MAMWSERSSAWKEAPALTGLGGCALGPERWAAGLCPAQSVQHGGQWPLLSGGQAGSREAGSRGWGAGVVAGS